MNLPEEFETKSNNDEDVPGAGTDENEKDKFDPDLFKPIDDSPVKTYF
ncbi:hypothetical protein KAJ89_03795 [Candidatus Parcubacteria bacterium]|nr:hypothetical protein [Candidatus Parcubacteria bacterium]